LFAFACLFAPLAAQSQATASLGERYTKSTAMVAMRDGVRLNTEVYAPKDAKGPLPILLERTPYSIRHDQDGIAAAIGTSYRELASSGYVFAFQDIRGKYGSEGTFLMVRPPRRGAEQTDESTDAYDTIAWLLQNVPGNNGRVGMLGISYGGWLTMMALVEPHPALRAASPQASPDCMWTGDDFHHNGAFRLSYGFEYVALVDGGRQNVPFAFDRADTYDWFLRLGGLGEVDASHFHGERPTWNEYVAHPDFDSFWQRRKVAPYFADKPVTVPVLTVAGFWDQEDWYGPLQLYAAMEENDDKGINHLVIGPWNHGGWARGDGSSLGPIQFGSPTAKYYREEVQAKWFAYWLRDEGTRDFAEVLTFRPGSNSWQRHDRWPPVQGVTKKPLYLRAGGRLSFAPPEPGESESSRYVSDPAHPVPYRQRPIAPLYGGKVRSTWSEWLVDDQRHAQSRPDVLTFESDVLAEDLTVSGNVVANLFASTTGSDADWVVKFIDVYPEDHPEDQKLAGWQLMVANDVFRGRYRKSFTTPEPLEPGKVTDFAIDLHAVDYTFLKGHRLMVQVQSTWFPLIDRNPQQFVPNIYRAKGSDYVAQEHRVFHARGRASCLQVAVVGP
jgi:hypothetical protein